MENRVTKRVRGRTRLVSPTPSADEMHNFQLVAVAKTFIGPVLTGNNIAIEFHGHAIRFHP